MVGRTGIGQNDSGSAGLIVGFIVAAVIVAATIYFGLPYLRGHYVGAREGDQLRKTELCEEASVTTRLLTGWMESVVH